MKVAIINGDGMYVHLFQRLGFELTSNIEEANLVCFTGGEDVTPHLYGDLAHPFTYNSLERDQYEMKMYCIAREFDIPMVGICRGAQFLNVMSGGRMYQHVSKHTRDHEITDLQTGETVWVTSTHHQMMMPSSEAVLVASSTLQGTREWFDAEVFRKDVSNQDIEVVFYPVTKCLCFQPHPEFIGEEYEQMVNYFNSLLSRFLGL
jgi:gamma-glutamyl-gamma-aminobutyrate hydrolase PuuD